MVVRDQDRQSRQRRRRGEGSSYDESSRRRATSGGRDADASFEGGLTVIFVLAAIAIVAAVGRLFWLQVIQGPTLAEQAQQTRTNVITLTAKRGTIYDRDGNVLATSIDCQTIYCNPQEVNHPAKIAKVLVDNIGGTTQDYIDLLTQDTTFVYLSKQVDDDVADAINDELVEKGLTGVYFLADTRRVYPRGATAGQILGVVGTDGHGITGLEYYYDDILTGTDGQMILEQGEDGTPIAGAATTITEAQDGTDIIISIDVDIQEMAEEAIADGVEKYGAESGLVMVTDPNTGEILAACSTPFADLTDLSDVEDGALNLKLVSDSYEPGSIFKLITMAIGIENDLITPNSSFSVPAEVLVGDDYVTDDDGRDYTMTMDIREILRRSSNAGAALVTQEVIGTEAFSEGIQDFGIGQLTGIDYPGEVEGLVKGVDEWDGSSLGSMSFGQGLAVPMVQMVRATGAFANGGMLVTPHFLVTEGGEDVDWGEGTRAISEGTASQITDMMVTVVDEGTATLAQVDGYEIAGKTGTGEQAVSGNGYTSYFYLSSLVGFAPADDPQVLCYVGLYGVSLLASDSAAPLFSEVMGEALTDMGVPPSS